MTMTLAAGPAIALDADEAQAEKYLIPVAAGAEQAPSLIRLSVSKDGSISARGKWVEKIKRGPYSPILPANAVEIQCRRQTMSCDEIRAEAGPPRDDPSLTRRSFTVTEWSAQRILARSDTDSADLMLRIYPPTQKVELSYWETKPQADRNSPADGFVWELQ